MATAYVDTSVLLGVEFREAGWQSVTMRLASFENLVAANLLEAEFRCALQRESRPYDPALLAGIVWAIPGRSLEGEVGRVLEQGPLRGADCWHLAVALFLAGDPRTVTFLTLDQRQAAVAKRLGFRS